MSKWEKKGIFATFLFARRKEPFVKSPAQKWAGTWDEFRAVHKFWRWIWTAPASGAQKLHLKNVWGLLWADQNWLKASTEARAGISEVLQKFK